MGGVDGDDFGWGREAQEAAEAETPGHPEPPGPGDRSRRTRRPGLFWTLVGLFFSGFLGAGLGSPSFGLCSVHRLHGENIEHAGTLVGVAAFAAFVATIVLRKEPSLMIVNLSLMTGVLTAGIVLVALDSAVWRGVEDCAGFFGGSSTEVSVRHVWFVCVVWGATGLVLLSHVGRLQRLRSHTAQEEGRSLLT
jgi:hypothetical protein